MLYRQKRHWARRAVPIVHNGAMQSEWMVQHLKEPAYTYGLDIAGFPSLDMRQEMLLLVEWR